jgi:hypothetical protein
MKAAGGLITGGLSMADNNGERAVTTREAWEIAVAVVVITLVAIVIVLVAFWDRLCAKIAIDALEYGIERLPDPK